MLTPCILIVEDEPDLMEILVLTIIKMGYKVLEANTVEKGIVHIQNFGTKINLVITDMRLPDALGTEIVQTCYKIGIPSIVMTAYGSTETAIQALKLGAVDYLIKPVPLDALRSRISEVLDKNSNLDRVHKNDSNSSSIQSLDNNINTWLIGSSNIMQKVKNTILQYAQSLAPVMITGASGSGKERVAKAIHMHSKRKGKFVAVNCGAIPENLMESEFFGVAKGAFTGATQARIGLFEEANHGTLFLDEIAELPLNMQTKLLRVLQERTVRALGSTQEQSIDVRIICATHKDMQDMVKQEKFRHDLYYRIHVLPLPLPNLNQRREDIPLLIHNILNNLNKIYHQDKTITHNALDKLINHNYTGNIRELENLLEAAYATNLDNIDIIAINPIYINDVTNSSNKDNFANQTNIEPDINILNNIDDKKNESFDDINFPINLPFVLADIEKEYIKKALHQYKNNQSAAAKALNLTLRQLRYRIEQLQLQIEEI
ncbi:MAG: hypothetical protein RLZZ210_1791 [Pseudomonadota bacterium]|jgi:two-component system response regulator PilR (NtrC family)